MPNDRRLQFDDETGARKQANRLSRSLQGAVVNWFDAIEVSLRARVCGFIEAMIESELGESTDQSPCGQSRLLLIATIRL